MLARDAGAAGPMSSKPLLYAARDAGQGGLQIKFFALTIAAWRYEV